MGQKVNPIGLRLGVSRKWAFSWFSPISVHKSLDSAQTGMTLLSQGVVSSRGGFFRSSIEAIIRNFFRRFLSFSKNKVNKSRRFLPMHIHRRKGADNHLFCFLFYIKLLGRQRRRVRKKGKRKKRY